MRRKLLTLAALMVLASNFSFAQRPIYIAFLWHMHQPIYWPGESVVQTINSNRYPFSVADVFNSRTGPYTSWPNNAVRNGHNARLANFGASVSFSGSLIENLNTLQSAGRGYNNWRGDWNTSRSYLTTRGNRRMDLIGFGYHHPLMPLLDSIDIRRQIRWHKQIFASNFNGPYSKGIFTPENAFANHIIPALKAEGLDWVLVDNIHFDRACNGYPFNTSGNLYEMNKSDQRNPNPNDWVQLNNLWAPTRNSARWGRQPHYVAYTDPATGQQTKMIAVPADRYMGNEDGRGGFGALNYEMVMSQLESQNTDPNHPILIVLHHDGDNYGGGSDSYYNGNFSSFINWLNANPNRFRCTTVQDYLDMFPPDTNDVIHVEAGSWSGADNGDPEFKKWNGDPNNCYSPDRNSWGVITAARNIVQQASQVNPTALATQNAWKSLMNGEASDYWYWDGSSNLVWDTHPTTASNQAIAQALPIARSGADNTPPAVYQPQREPYNPGEREWNQLQSSNFTVWTYAFDLSGLRSVKLKYRVATGANTSPTADNKTYAGGSSVGAWTELVMNSTFIRSQANAQPTAKAREYWATITGIGSKLVDYYVEAIDSANNTYNSPISHVWVGAANTIAHTWRDCGNPNGGGVNPVNPIPPGVSWIPQNPGPNDTITIRIGNAGRGARLHWGVNGWQLSNPLYRPAGTQLFQTGPAVQSSFGALDSLGNLKIKVGPFNRPEQVVNQLNFVINYEDNTWDNNGGQDYRINISQVNSAEKLLWNGIGLYPNPFQVGYNLRATQALEGVTVTFYDMLGKELGTSQVIDGTLSTNCLGNIKTATILKTLRYGNTLRVVIR